MIATINGFTLSLEKTGKYQDGFAIFRYKVVTAEPYVIFTGESFKPSIAAVRNALLIPIELLQWICLEYATNDHSLFEDYRTEQMAFASCGNIEKYSDDADQFWLMIDLKQYKTFLDYNNTKIIMFENYNQPYIFMRDNT